MIGQFSIIWRIIDDVASQRGIEKFLITGPFTSPAINAARQEVQGRAAEIGLDVSPDCCNVSKLSVR